MGPERESARHSLYYKFLVIDIFKINKFKLRYIAFMLRENMFRCSSHLSVFFFYSTCKNTPPVESGRKGKMNMVYKYVMLQDSCW